MPRALLAALLFFIAGCGVAADAAVAVEIAAGKSKNIRLRNVPAGTTMAVRITTTGKILVALISKKRAALFRAAVERRLSFRVSIREQGDYFLVLSNRDGKEPVEVKAEIRAAAPEALLRSSREGQQIAQVVVHP